MTGGWTVLDVAADPQRLDQRRELALRHLTRGVGEAAHRADHGPRDEPDEHEGQEHGEHRGAAVETHVAQAGAGVRSRRR